MSTTLNGHTPCGQGSNSAVVRQFNERIVLAALRRLGEASKADLARHVNLTQNAAGQIVRDLEQQNLIRTSGKRVGQRGQPATLLRLDPAGAYAIGVKLGRRSVDSLLVDFSGKILKARRHDRAFPSPEEALRLIRDDVAALRRAVPEQGRARLAGVGLALPYNLGAWRRELDIPEAISAAWNGFDLEGRLRAVLDLPVVVENDGNAIAVAELFGGHGRELDDFAVVYIGTALGGGLVLGGTYRRGVHGNAGDFGLMPVAPSRLPSAPRPDGPFDILLNRASLGSLLRHLRWHGVAADTEHALERATATHRPLVAEWLDDCADALCAPLLGIAAMLDLQAIIIDGNFARDLLTELIDRVRRALARAAPEAREPPALRLGTMGPNAAARGAATLPLHLNYGPDQELLFA